MNHTAEDALKELVSDAMNAGIGFATMPDQVGWMQTQQQLVDELLALFTSTLQQEHAHAEEKLIQRAKKMSYDMSIFMRPGRSNIDIVTDLHKQFVESLSHSDASVQGPATQAAQPSPADSGINEEKEKCPECGNDLYRLGNKLCCGSDSCNYEKEKLK